MHKGNDIKENVQVVAVSVVGAPTPQNRFAMLIVPLSLGGVTQTFVRLLDEAKLFGRRIIANVLVGVQLERQFAVRLFDRSRVGVAFDAQDFVVTTNLVGRHSSASTRALLYS